MAYSKDNFLNGLAFVLSMLFCPKCGSIMKPQTESGKKYFACSCGYAQGKEGIASPKKETFKEQGKVQIVGDDEHVYPLTDAICPKCGHKKAYYWLVQMRAGDEPETKFLKCEKCKHTWRDNS